MNRYSWIVFAIATAALFFVTGAVDAKTKLDWNPERTSVFVVGVLEWQHPEIWSPFPECMKERRDLQLVNYFRDAGVPDDRIVYLQDAQAIKSRIRKQFEKLLDDTDKGDLLVFYFCGHGYRDDETGQTWFANYDAGEKDSSAWNVRNIFATIEEHFSGGRVLMLADCCHSGALYDEALKRRDANVEYAVITSSYSHNTSTGNWTFSDSLLAGLRGEPEVDLNDDKVIELDELAHYTELELAFIEGQKAMFTSASEFPRAAHLAKVEGELTPGVGGRVEAEFDGKWFKAKIIDVSEDQVEVHYVDFDNTWDEWVSRDRVRPYQPPQFAAGDKVEVHWQTDGDWYPATVRKAWYGLELVRYDGFDSSCDEWVGADSIRLRTE